MENKKIDKRLLHWDSKWFVYREVGMENKGTTPKLIPDRHWWEQTNGYLDTAVDSICLAILLM